MTVNTVSLYGIDSLIKSFTKEFSESKSEIFNNMLTYYKVKNIKDYDLGLISELPPELQFNIFSFVDIWDMHRKFISDDDYKMLFIVQSLSKENFEILFNHYIDSAMNDIVEIEKEDALSDSRISECIDPDVNHDFGPDVENLGNIIE